MSLMIPPDAEGLVNALLVLTAGDLFPKADEDALRALADQARVFSNSLGNEIVGLDALVFSAVDSLDTSAGRAFARYGHKLDQFGAGITGQADQIAEILDDFALSAENAKYQIIIGATITAAMIAWGFATPWGAALVAPYTTGLRAFVVKVWSRYTNSLQLMLKGAITESAQETGSAFLSQLIQVLEGNRKTWDGKDIGIAAGVGAGAGFFAPIASGIVRVSDNVIRGNRNLADNWKHFANTHNPANPPSVVTQLTHNTLTEGLTELVIAAATLPLGGAITGLGLSVASGIFSGFTETAADLTGQHLYDKHNATPPPDAPPPPPPSAKPTDNVRGTGNTIGADGDSPPPATGSAAMHDPGNDNPTRSGAVPYSMSTTTTDDDDFIHGSPSTSSDAGPSHGENTNIGNTAPLPVAENGSANSRDGDIESSTASTGDDSFATATASAPPSDIGDDSFVTATTPSPTTGNTSFVTANAPPPTAGSPSQQVPQITGATGQSSKAPTDTSYHTGASNPQGSVSSGSYQDAVQTEADLAQGDDPVQTWIQQNAAAGPDSDDFFTAPQLSDTTTGTTTDTLPERHQTPSRQSDGERDRTVHYATDSSPDVPAGSTDTDYKTPPAPTDLERKPSLERGFIRFREPKEPGVPKVIVHEIKPDQPETSGEEDTFRRFTSEEKGKGPAAKPDGKKPTEKKPTEKKPKEKKTEEKKTEEKKTGEKKATDETPSGKKPPRTSAASTTSLTDTDASFDPRESEAEDEPPKFAPKAQGWSSKPAGPDPDPTTNVAPSDAIVSVGVPKGRLPSTRDLVVGLRNAVPELRDTHASVWNDFGREVLAKFRQIAYDRRRRGIWPPLSHPFEVNGVSLLISLELAFDQVVADPSGERDGLPDNHPLRKKRGRISGVETVNGQYDLGTTNKTLSGSTAYTQLNIGPSGEFARTMWTPGFTFSFAFDINRNTRSIGTVKDAEIGRVEDSRAELVYLAYRPTWVVRVLNPDGTTERIDIPVARRDNERVVLAVANHYARPAPGIPPARIEEVGDDQQQVQRNWRSPANIRPQQHPNPDFPHLPDHYFATGLTNIDLLYQSALASLSAENIENFNRASIQTRLWNLAANLHFAADPNRPHGYRFPVFDNKSRIIALIQINTRLFPNGLRGVERIGEVSDQVHIEDVATAIDGYTGGHSISHSLAVNPGFPTSITLPGRTVGLSAALAGQFKAGNSNGISTSRVSLWVHVSRFVGRTGAYSIPMDHTISVFNPNRARQSVARPVRGRALIRMPEREAARRFLELEPNSPYHNREEVTGQQGSRKDFTRGVGMGLVRVSNNTVREIYDFIANHLGHRGFLHRGRQPLDRTRLDSIRTHQQMENEIALEKLVSQSALRSNYDMIHQDGYTFTLQIPSNMPIPTIPAGRMTYAKITITAEPTDDGGQQRQVFKGTTSDFHSVNLAMGMGTIGESVGGSTSVKVGVKAGLFDGLLRNLTLAGLSVGFNRSSNNETKRLNNRPELLEYANEVEQWDVYSDWMVGIEFQDAPVLSSALPQFDPVRRPLLLRDQPAQVYTLDFINGLDEDIPALPSRDTDLASLPDRVLDNAVVYKVDTTGMREEMLGMLAPFSGPAGYADQELSTMTGTTSVRAWFREAVRDKVQTDLPFIPGWRKDLHGTASIKAHILSFDFQGATRESFTLGVIKMGLVSTSMSQSDVLTLYPELVNDVTIGGPAAGPAELSGRINAEPTYTFGSSENVTRESAVERIQLKFGPAYKFRADVAFELRASTELGGKFISSNLRNVPGRSRRRRPGRARPPQMRVRRKRQAGGQQANLIESSVEILVPERDALEGYVVDALPITREQLHNVMRRYVDTKPGNAPPISGTLAAKVLARWHEQEQDNADISNYAAAVLEGHRSNDPRFFVDAAALEDANRLAPEATQEVKPVPFEAPSYMRSDPVDERILGHSGIRAVTYRQYTEGNRPLGSTSIYDTIVDLVSSIDPRALSHDVQHPRRTSRLRTIQGVAEGLESVLGRGREDAFIDDFMGNGGYTFQLINPTNWFLSAVIEINVKMRLKNDFRMLDVSPMSGMENYTHGYTGKSRTSTTGGALAVSGRFTTALIKDTSTFRGTVKGSANTGASRALSTLTTVASEQTVYDWSGHVDFDVTHETIVTVRRVDMNERWVNNMLLAANRSMTRFFGNMRRADPAAVPLVEQNFQRLFGKVKLEIPMSIANGRRPAAADVPPINPVPVYVGPLPGDATVSGNALDGLEPAAQRMLIEIQRRAWTIQNLRNAIMRTDTLMPNPSMSLKALLSRTSLNGHLPAAIGGQVHRLAENLIIPGLSEYVITVDLVGELLRDGVEVLLETTNSGSGRYNKQISRTSHSNKVDNWRGAMGADIGYTNSRTPPNPSVPEGQGGKPSGFPIGTPSKPVPRPRPDQIVGGGADSGRATSLGVTATENRGSRWEQHQKAVVNDQAGGTDEKMYIVKFTGRFRLIGSVRNRNLPGINAWPDPFRSNWVQGPVIVTMTKSQYVAMMTANYRPTREFRRELDIVSNDGTPPNYREPDNRFRPATFDPERPGRAPQAVPLREGEELVPLRPDGSGRRPQFYRSSFASSSPSTSQGQQEAPNPYQPYQPRYRRSPDLTTVSGDESDVFPPGQYRPPQYVAHEYPPRQHFEYLPEDEAPRESAFTSLFKNLLGDRWGRGGREDAQEIPMVRRQHLLPPSENYEYDVGPGIDELSLAARGQHQMRRLNMLVYRDSRIAVNTRSPVAEALPDYQIAGITQHFLDMPAQYEADMALLELIRRAGEFPDLETLAETLRLVGRERMLRVFDGQPDSDWDTDRFLGALSAVQHEVRARNTDAAQAEIARRFPATPAPSPPAGNKKEGKPPKTVSPPAPKSTTTRQTPPPRIVPQTTEPPPPRPPRNPARTEIGVDADSFLRRMRQDPNVNHAILETVVRRQYGVLQEHGVPQALHDRMATNLADRTLARLLVDIGLAREEDRQHLAADIAQAIGQFDAEAFRGLDRDAIRSQIHDARRALPQNAVPQTPSLLPTHQGQFEARSLLNRTLGTRSAERTNDLRTLVALYYPVLLSEGVPQALSAHLDTQRVDQILVTLLDHLGNTNATPERAGEVARAILRLHPRTFQLGLSIDQTMDVVRLVANNQIHPGYFRTATLERATKLITDIRDQVREYHRLKDAARSKRSSQHAQRGAPQQTRGGTSRTQLTRPQAPINALRTLVVDIVTQEPDAPTQSDVENTFGRLVLDAGTDRLVILPNQALVAHVIALMIVRDANRYRGVFDRFRSDQLSELFAADSTWTAEEIVDLLDEVHDRRKFAKSSDQQIEQYVDRQLGLKKIRRRLP